MRIYQRYGKRFCDVIVASVLLVALAPVIAIVALLVRLRLGSPVLFRQVRPGWRERPFTLLKFRTMLDETDASGVPLPDNRRLTPFGALLRKWSLDELPEFLNVLRGELSLVGPRPLRVEYLPLYSPSQRRRHEVRPGITGLAQVAGRNRLSWQDRFKLDVEYVDNVSLGMDIRIVFRTLAVVLTHRDVAQDGFATADWFRGNDV